MTAPGNPQLRPHYRPFPISEKGVLLLRENGARVLYGSLYERLIPLLDGTRSAEELVQMLAPEFTAAEICLTLISLQTRGYLCQAVTSLPPLEAAFWAELGVDPEQAAGLINSTRVALQRVGPGVDDSTLEAMRQALVDVGLIVVDHPTGADLTLVMCEHYLHPELESLNQRFRQEGRRWLLLRPLGRAFWLGPMFDPQQPGCYACLHRLLMRQSQVELFAAGLTESPNQLLTMLGLAPGGGVIAARLAALEASRILANAAPQSAGQIISLDFFDYSCKRHALVIDPQCPVCGKAPVPRFDPLVLQPCAVHFNQDGGHRHVSAEQTLEHFGKLVSPISGIVSELRSVSSSLPSVHVVLAGHNPAQKVVSLDDLRSNLRSGASGKGASLIQARASALGEALERFSAEDHPGVVRERGSLQSMRDRYGDSVIHPNAVMGYSEKQFAERKAWNARGSRFNRVPEFLDSDLEIDWTPIWSLSREQRCFLPTQLLYLNARGASRDGKGDSDAWIAMGCSNGNAAGNTTEEAVLQGVLELVERDSTAIWWYNRLLRPGIDLANSGDAWITKLVQDYGSVGREVWALDLTTDLGITSVVALSRHLQGRAERILMGLGCHLDPRIAVKRALAEMNQMLGIADANLDGAEDGLSDGETQEWLNTATVANQPYLQPDPSVPLRRIEELCEYHSGDLLGDIQYCCHCIEAQGMEVLALDQTREIIGLPVVKVVVPGLRHFWARYASGRLYDVPVQMGVLPHPLREDQLNPIAIFF